MLNKKLFKVKTTQSEKLFKVQNYATYRHVSASPCLLMDGLSYQNG